MGIAKGSRLRGAYQRETLAVSRQANLSRNGGAPKVSAEYEEVVFGAAGEVGVAHYEWIMEYRSRWCFFLSLTHARRMSGKAAARRWEAFVGEAGLRDLGFVHVQGKQASGNPDHHALLAGEPDLKMLRKAWLKGNYGGRVHCEPIRNVEGAAAYLVTRNRYYLPIVEMLKD